LLICNGSDRCGECTQWKAKCRRRQQKRQRGQKPGEQEGATEKTLRNSQELLEHGASFKS
jgi:hypothetical protein